MLSGEAVKFSLRKTLADSHVSAVAIAVLLFWSLDNIFWAVWPAPSRGVGFLFTAVAILDIPYFSSNPAHHGSFRVIPDVAMLFQFTRLSGRSVRTVSLVYGTGPLRSLMQ